MLHSRDEEKKDDFRKVLERKLDQKDYDFGGTVFPEGTSDFNRHEFDANVNFSGATLIGQANFSVTKFGGEAIFSGAQFDGEAIFSDAQFNDKTYISATKFGGETSFSGARFEGEWTYFTEAQFGGEANFTEAQFDGEAIFSGAQFDGETIFTEAQFGGETSFLGAQFNGERTYLEAQFGGETDFSGAQFGGEWTFFQQAIFVKEVDFRGAIFRENVNFWGSRAHPIFDPEAWVWFTNVRIERPELFTFRLVLLHPAWFINTDVRKVGFTNVRWYGMPGGVPEGTLDEEISALATRDVESPHALYSQVCQRLSANAEENQEYPLANEFHYWSMDALRKEGWHSFGLIRTLYWALSGYGVRATRAFLVLLGIWVTFTILYILVPSSPFSGFSISDFQEAIVYSLGAIARLNPEPRPDEPGMFQFLVTVEGLLGPLQIALLALAIRRKVMR